MKRRFGRENALLLLPVLALAGVVCLQGSDGKPLLARLNAAKLLDKGPIRLEYQEFQPSELKPLDVFEGFDWAVETRLVERGRWDMPAGWAQGGGNIRMDSSSRVIYRKGKTWKAAAQPSNGNSLIGSTYGPEQAFTTRVNLETVPSDAVEVRLRGKFVRQEWYQGPIPRGWKPPANLKITGLNRILEFESKPFDIPIVELGEAFPKSQASRESHLSFVKAFYQDTNLGGWIHLQLHRDPKFGLPDEGKDPWLVSYTLLDGKGRKLDACDTGGTGRRYLPASFGTMPRSGLDAKFPETDILLGVLSGQGPCGGWAKYKGPFILEMEFSDGGAWPLKVRVPIRWDDLIGYNEYPFR